MRKRIKLLMMALHGDWANERLLTIAAATDDVLVSRMRTLCEVCKSFHLNQACIKCTSLKGVCSLVWEDNTVLSRFAGSDRNLKITETQKIDIKKGNPGLAWKIHGHQGPRLFLSYTPLSSTFNFHLMILDSCFSSNCHLNILVRRQEENGKKRGW